MLSAVSFLTVVGRAAAPSPRALPAFPVVGALIGLAVGGVWWGAGELWPPLIAAVLAVAADAVITGLLHLDGLSDAADGLLPPLDRDRRLAVMRDPAVGAFGAVTLIVVLALRIAAFASMPAAPWLVAALWCASRAAMAVIATIMRYARADGGIATAFRGGPGPWWRWVVPLGLGLVIAAGLAAVDVGWRAVIVLGCAALGSVAVAALARVRLGGFTGDVLGAAGVIGETAGLMAAAAL